MIVPIPDRKDPRRGFGLSPRWIATSARSLNIELQAVLNPAGDRKVERFGWTFAPGDKVMQIENDYDKEVYKATSATDNNENYSCKFRKGELLTEQEPDHHSGCNSPGNTNGSTNRDR
jgi:hypothetical protein